jgi:hypothetical protein
MIHSAQPNQAMPNAVRILAWHPGRLIVEYIQHTEAADRFRVTAL